MAFEQGEDIIGSVCPHLGLADDADSHATFATEAHRCYRMPNPTRIASNHQENFCLGANHTTCPVFLGEGVAGSQRAAAQAAPTSLPRPGGRQQAPARGAAGVAAAGTAAGNRNQLPRPGAARKPRDPGSLGPRPRAGGISMPAMTAGLFVLAIVIIAIAVYVVQRGGDEDNGDLTQAQRFGTQQALASTQTAQTPRPTQPTGQTQTPGQTQQPGQATTAPGTSPTAANRTTTPGAGGNTYTVKSGDFCGTIAAANNITLEQLLRANNMQESDCSNLQIGQVLKLP